MNIDQGVTQESKDSLGDRMKGFESGREVELFKNLPIICRLDGKAFHTFTRGLERPYDKRLTDLMVETTKFLVAETNAVIGYTQSDEISLVLYSAEPKSQVYFDGRKSKILSILAATASVFFNRELPKFLPEKATAFPLFDCRVFNVPSKVEAVNCLIWRELDATRNSVSMAAQHYFSHKKLHGVSCNNMQEMLFTQKGVNWNDYPAFFKRGTYVQRRKSFIKFSAAELEKLPPLHEARTNPDLVVERSEVVIMDTPPLTKVVNREDFVFSGAPPLEPHQAIS